MTFMTKEQFLAHLDDIRNQVANGTSFEGTINYTTFDDRLKPNEFNVEGVYRHDDNSHQLRGLRCISSSVYGYHISSHSVISPLSKNTVSSFNRVNTYDI